MKTTIIILLALMGLFLFTNFQCGKNYYAIIRNVQRVMDIKIKNSSKYPIGIDVSIRNSKNIKKSLSNYIIKQDDSISVYYKDTLLSNSMNYGLNFECVFYNLQDTTFTKWQDYDIRRVHTENFMNPQIVDKVADKVLKQISIYESHYLDASALSTISCSLNIDDDVFPIVFRKDYTMLKKFSSFYGK